MFDVCDEAVSTIVQSRSAGEFEHIAVRITGQGLLYQATHAPSMPLLSDFAPGCRPHLTDFAAFWTSPTANSPGGVDPERTGDQFGSEGAERKRNSVRNFRSPPKSRF